MILSRPEILNAIRLKKLKIEPFVPSLVGPCSVDFRLGYDFKKIKKKEVIRVRDDLNYKDDFHDSFSLKQNEPVVIKPNELILGVTLERFSLSSSICGWIEGRSKIARLGLLVHVSSGFIQPGSNNHQVLEIVNMSPQKLYLYPEAVVGQIIFQEVKGNAKYNGSFQNQKKP